MSKCHIVGNLMHQLKFISTLTCFGSDISIRNEVRMEERAFGTKADVKSRRWLLTEASLKSGRDSTLLGKLYFFSSRRSCIISSRCC